MEEISYTQAIGRNTESGPSRPMQNAQMFVDFLTMKVIEQKRVQQFGNRYGANANVLGFSQRKDLLRNLGVRVDAIRLAELDAVTEFLGCNKQEFVLELLASGLEQAKLAAEQAGLKPVLNAIIDRKVEEAGFTVEPSPNDGYWTLHFKGQPIQNGKNAEQSEALSSTSGVRDTALESTEE